MVVNDLANKQKDTKYIGIFIVLFLLAFAFEIQHLEYVFGISFGFSSVFLWLIFRLYGLPYTIASALLVQVAAILLFNHSILNLLYLPEYIILGLFMLRKPRVPMLLGGGAYWLFIGGPLFMIVYQVMGLDIQFEHNLFQVSKDGLNQLFNLFVVELLLTYIPIENWLKGKKKNQYFIHFRKFIYHIMLIALVMPFIINSMITNWSYYESVQKQASELSQEMSGKIYKELKQWDSSALQRLMLSGIVERSQLQDIIMKYTSPPVSGVVITDLNGNIIAKNIDLGDDVKKYNWQENVNVTNIEDNFYQVLPYDKENDPEILRWLKGEYIYFQNFDFTTSNIAMKAFIKTPIEGYKNEVINEFFQQLKLFLVFAIFILVAGLFINWTLFKNIKELAVVTSNLPQQVRESESIPWPKSNVMEVRSLIDNFKSMSVKLSDMFAKSDEFSKKLANQAEQLADSKERLHELAYYDALTDLPNRLNFRQKLVQFVNDKALDKQKLAIMFIDLDNFKEINDNLGHDVGDILLRSVSERLRGLETEHVSIFRLGGDEFVVLSGANDIEELRLVSSMLINCFIAPFRLKDGDFKIACSVGISVYPDDATDVDELVKYADMAMYRAKERGGNRVQLFNRSIREEFHEQYSIEQGIRRALDSREFELHFQPKWNTLNHTLSSMEVLIRWNSPTLGFVSPAKFIPIAEDSGLIIEIDCWVLKEACTLMKQWQSEGYPHVPFSVNISAQHFSNPHLIEHVQEALAYSNLDAKYLKIEITEGVLIRNVQLGIESIVKLNGMGVEVSIDDFGKGYSSLHQLINLPISELKIDRDFITNIHEDETRASVVRLIVQMAHELKLNVVAEGVELEEEKQFLESIQCDELQGYLISRPLSFQPLKEFFESKYEKSK
ncbi:MAG: putative bifunctional diguanylate cyclase/phosphodiesterase [Bacilli bacterium]